MKSLALALLLANPGHELAPMALNSYSVTPARIANAPVMDPQGHMIGRVRAVQADQDGKPAAISIIRNDGRDLAIVGAAAVSYDEPNNTVVTDADTAHLAQN